MLTNSMPMLRISSQVVNDRMVEGYNIECPDRSGFVYAQLSADHKTLFAMLNYNEKQYSLMNNEYLGLVDDASIDQCFRKILIDASQAALTIMYE